MGRLVLSSLPLTISKSVLVVKRKGVSFSIVDDTDKNKFTLSGTALTFEATDFNKDGGGNSNNYPVTIRATRDNETVEKILTVSLSSHFGITGFHCTPCGWILYGWTLWILYG
jgi:hypothetical protein